MLLIMQHQKNKRILKRCGIFIIIGTLKYTCVKIVVILLLYWYYTFVSLFSHCFHTVVALKRVHCTRSFLDLALLSRREREVSLGIGRM
jgi:hypothetical protein